MQIPNVVRLVNCNLTKQTDVHATPDLDLDSTDNNVWSPMTHVPVMEWLICHNNFKHPI